MAVDLIVTGLEEREINGPLKPPIWDGNSGTREGQHAYDSAGVIDGIEGPIYWDGSSWIKYGNGSGSLVFQTLSDMRAVPLSRLSPSVPVQLLGYFSAGDDKGGTYRWSPGSTLADDQVNVIKINGSVTGRLLRIDIADVKIYSPVPEYFTYPSGFTFRPAAFYKTRVGQWDCSIKDIKQFAQPFIDKQLSPVYVDPVSGSDSNNGRSQGAAFATIPFAITQARLIYVLPGFYDRNHSFSSTTDTDSNPLVIICIDPNNTYFTSAEPTTSLVWSLDTGTTYKATRSNVLSVVDMLFKDAYGEFQMYEKKSTLALCRAQQGSWYTDNVTTYVNRLDGSIGDDNLKLLLASSQLIEVSGTAPFYYIEGGKFWGSNVYGALQLRHITPDVQPPTKIYLKNCDFAYNQTPTGGGNGLGIINLKEVWTWNCKAHNNWADGFNYHTNEATFTKMKVFEKDNVGFNNGVYNTSITNNGSTVHDGIQVIRLGGIFFNNRGPNVADVNTGTQSLNIAVTAYNTLLDPGDVNAADFTSADAVMYVIEGVSYGSAISLNHAGAGSISVKKSIYSKRVGNIIYL